MKVRCALSWVLVSASTLVSAEFFVAPHGDDAGPGTRSQPFATFARAQTAVRAERAAGRSAVTVSFKPGTYDLAETLVFHPEDSGDSADSPVTYQAETGGEVVFSGGRTLSNWQPDPNRRGVWKTRVPGEPGQWTFNQLWVDGRRAIRARTPNYWEFSVLNNVLEEPASGGAGARKHTFTCAPRALAVLQDLSAEEVREVEVLVFHKWDTTRERLTSAAPSDGLFTTQGSAMQSWNRMERNCLFFFENLLPALDQPGEWFLAKDGWLYYMPRPGEDMSRVRVVAPRLTQFLRLEGEAPNPARWVRHLVFRGLKFRYGELTIPRAGFPPAQAAMNVDAAAVLLDAARDVRFSDCAVEHVGATPFWFRHATRDCRLERSRLFDSGVGGVRIGETRIVPEPVRTGRITVDNCIIQSGGRLLPHAVAVWIGHSGENAVTYCDVGDFFYTAVSVGWRWGYDESPAKRNRIENNHLHHLGYRILSDMGGVYTLGPSEGTVVRGNVIHDVYSTRYGGWGLYPDEGSTGILFENNLVYDVRDGCVHQHYGKENVFRNNILAFSEEGQVAITRAEPHLTFTFERNIVFWDDGYLLGYAGWKAGAKVELRRNLYWRAGGKPFDFAGLTWDEWRAKGRDEGSITADPLFVNAAARDFRLKPGSPAEKIGFQPFDSSQAGVHGSPEWVALARATTYPKPYVVPQPEPLSLRDDFENPGISAALSSAAIDAEGKSAAVIVTDALSASGKRALQVREDVGLKAEYNPHFYWDPHWSRGQARMSFQIRVEAGADLRAEWRSSGHPYRTGPGVRFKAGNAFTLDGVTVQLPVGVWAAVEIVSSLGQTENRWQFRVTLPDGRSVGAKDQKAEFGWKEARWIGFSSHGLAGTTYYLDDLVLQAEPD